MLFSQMKMPQVLVTMGVNNFVLCVNLAAAVDRCSLD